MLQQRYERWISIGRWVLLASLGLLIAFLPMPKSSAAPMDRTIRIQASRFNYQPGMIYVQPGDRVTIELSAADVAHGLAIDGYGLETTAEPGRPARLTFLADRQGSFRFRCTVTCGNLHPFMLGSIRVGPNTLFWRGVLLAALALLAGVWSIVK